MITYDKYRLRIQLNKKLDTLYLDAILKDNAQKAWDYNQYLGIVQYCCGIDCLFDSWFENLHGTYKNAKEDTINLFTSMFNDEL